MARRRAGRRPGKQDTRAAILEAARVAFAAHGYDAASIRRIAADADVDPALVHHYFGTKEELFHAVVNPPISPGSLFPKVFTGDRATIPDRLLRTFLDVWESPVTGPPFIALLRGGVTNRLSSRLMREFFVQQIQRRLLRSANDTGLSPAEIPLRSSLVASQLLGLVLARYIIQIEPLATASHDQVVAAIGPTLQRYLFGELGLPA